MPTPWLPDLPTWDPRPPTSPSEEKPCHFLRLPLELRAQILGYLLPYSISSNVRSKPYIWHRSSIATLRLNRQIHAEATRILYGCNVFVLDVAWDGIVFTYNWHLNSGLVPGTTLKFPGIELVERNIKLMRRFFVRVKIEHEYLGGIKYGYVGLGLAEGVRRQIERLAGILRGLETVEWLCLRLERLGCVSARRRNGDSSKLESVLDGLRILENTRVVKLEGDVTPDIVKEFEWLLARKGSRVSGRSSDNLEHVRTSVGDRRDPFTIDIR